MDIDFIVKLGAVFGSLTALILGILAWNKDKFKMRTETDTIKRKEVSDILQKLYNDLKADMAVQKKEYENEIDRVKKEHRKELDEIKIENTKLRKDNEAKAERITILEGQIIALQEQLDSYGHMDNDRVDHAKEDLHHDVEEKLEDLKK